MTVKELKKILKRFPKNAAIVVNDNQSINISAAVNQAGVWTVKINTSTKNNSEIVGKNLDKS